MEGRALNRTARQGWAWIVPLVGIGLVESLDALGASVRTQHAVAYVGGLGAGALWQLLYRRDRVDRGWWLAVVWTVIAAGSLVGQGEIEIDAPTAAIVYAVFVVAGLVLCEYVLRWRDCRSVAGPPAGDVERPSPVQR